MKFGKKITRWGGGGWVSDDGTYNLGVFGLFWKTPKWWTFLELKKNCCDRAICSLTCSEGAKFGTKQKKFGPTHTPPPPPACSRAFFPLPLFCPSVHLSLIFSLSFSFSFCSRWFSMIHGGRVAHTRAHQ